MVPPSRTAGEYVRSTFEVGSESQGFFFALDLVPPAGRRARNPFAPLDSPRMTARPPRGSRSGPWSLGLALIGSALCAACCVAPPKAGDLLAVGFRTPDQAFATFQTAVRADDPGAQYRCLSADFLRRNGLSEIAFREYLQLDREEPLLRKGIADARPASPAEVRADLARLLVVSHGRSIRIDLVREDFCEAWAGGEKVADEAAPFRERTGVQPAADGSSWVYGRMPLPPGTAPDRVTELRFGREWKIDGFHLEEDAPARAEAARDTLGAGDAVP